MNKVFKVVDTIKGEQDYLKSGISDGLIRIGEHGASSVKDMIVQINKVVQDAYCRFNNLARRGEYKTTLLRNWESLGNAFERWIFERLVDNINKSIENSVSPISTVIIHAGYKIKNNNKDEWIDVINMFKSDTPFDCKLREFIKINYPSLIISHNIKCTFGVHKDDIILMTLPIIIYDEKVYEDMTDKNN